MIKTVLIGALGKMGKRFIACAEKEKDVIIVAGADVRADCITAEEKAAFPFPIYDSADKIFEKSDVTVDFSCPDSLNSVINYCEKNRSSLLYCTTGLNETQKKSLETLSEKVAVLIAPNVSKGANILIKTAVELARLIPESEIEIVETHNANKHDCPSGTAIAAAEELISADKNRYYTLSETERKDKKEIRIHSLRLGVSGCEHKIVFASGNERITLSHEVADMSVFGEGAINAAKFIASRKSGTFTMKDIF